MKRLAFALLLVPTIAVAQPATAPQAPDPHTAAAMSQTINDLMQVWIGTRAALIAAQARVAELETALAKATPSAPAPGKPPVIVGPANSNTTLKCDPPSPCPDGAPPAKTAP